jgi:hypothetical protein
MHAAIELRSDVDVIVGHAASLVGVASCLDGAAVVSRCSDGSLQLWMPSRGGVGGLLLRSAEMLLRTDGGHAQAGPITSCGVWLFVAVHGGGIVVCEDASAPQAEGASRLVKTTERTLRPVAELPLDAAVARSVGWLDIAGTFSSHVVVQAPLSLVCF